MNELLDVLAFAAFFVAVWLMCLTADDPPPVVAEVRHYRLIVVGVRAGVATAATLVLFLLWLVM